MNGQVLWPGGEDYVVRWVTPRARYQTINLHLLPFTLRTLWALGESSTLGFYFKNCFRDGTSFREKGIRNFTHFPTKFNMQKIGPHHSHSGSSLFVANTERAGQSKPSLQDARLRALSSHLDQDLSVDANNCVVHAIEIYLSRSKGHCKVCKRLLIAYKPGNAEEIKPSTTSTWIVKTFHYVHGNLPDTSALRFKVRAHEIRGLRYCSWNAPHRESSAYLTSSSVASSRHIHVVLLDWHLFHQGGFVQD